MGTADSEEYMTESCPYETEQEKKQAEIKRFNMRVLVEPLLILAVIFGYCAIQVHAQHRDLQSKIAEVAKQRAAICHIKQNNTIHQFNCQVINASLAVIK